MIKPVVYAILKVKPIIRLIANRFYSEKALLIEEIKDVVENLLLVKQGKMKGKNANDLLNEL